jgi:hypothetical protein
LVPPAGESCGNVRIPARNVHIRGCGMKLATSSGFGNPALPRAIASELPAAMRQMSA